MDNETGNSLISFGEFVRAMWAVQGSQSEARDQSYANRQFNSSELPVNKVRESGASLKPPSLAKYDFNQQRVADLLIEYGAMLPSKDVYCTPDPKVINFLK